MAQTNKQRVEALRSLAQEVLYSAQSSTDQGQSAEDVTGRDKQQHEISIAEDSTGSSSTRKGNVPGQSKHSGSNSNASQDDEATTSDDKHNDNRKQHERQLASSASAPQHMMKSTAEMEATIADTHRRLDELQRQMVHQSKSNLREIRQISQRMSRHISSTTATKPALKYAAVASRSTIDDGSSSESSAEAQAEQSNSDGGYAGSASSNEDSGGDQSGDRSFYSLPPYPYPECHSNEIRKHHHHHNNVNKSNKKGHYHSSSSALADFSSGSLTSHLSDMGDNQDRKMPARRTVTTMGASSGSSKPKKRDMHKRPRSSSSSSDARHTHAKMRKAASPLHVEKGTAATTARMQTPGAGAVEKGVAIMERSLMKYQQYYPSNSRQQPHGTNFHASFTTCSHTHRTIFSLSSESMANVMSYLNPKDVHYVLTAPVSWSWRTTFTIPQDLWRILCLSAPFYARLSSPHTGDVLSDTSSDDSNGAGLGVVPPVFHDTLRHAFGRYRLLYTSFIQCINYLEKIRRDRTNGTHPSQINNTEEEQKFQFFNRQSRLGAFLARAKRAVIGRHTGDDDEENRSNVAAAASSSASSSSAVVLSDRGVSVSKKLKKNAEKDRVRFGRSKLTQRILGPPQQAGYPGNVNLPWSCSIYSVVNWMVAFSDVLGIQIMCLKVVPYLLECEHQRTTAQRAGLTDIVLNAMVLFPDIVELHTAAFHAFVLLARPLGGKEGMLFSREYIDGNGIFNISTQSGRNGVAVMLDSLRRFNSCDNLQSMGCWAMVNIALNPNYKKMLVKLGGISVTLDAMMMHPYNPEVQYRALFALINMVVISEESADTPEAAAIEESLGTINDISEREILDENVEKITNLVVVSMKNFCSMEAILNRACLVLNNLSLHEDYHTTLLWTPNCYQMLEWAIGNYMHDRVLVQSAGGTLQRLQMTLSNNEGLRERFAASFMVQEELSVEQARREGGELLQE